MATLKQYNSDPMHENIRGFEMELKKKFPDLRVTSGFRPKAFTKKGFVSRHAKGEAIDIEPRQDIYDFLWNTEEGISLMYKYGVGILDERSKEMLEKTGGSGAHFHVGMDSTLVPKMQQRYAELKNMNSKETFLSDSQQLPNFAYNQTANVMLPDYATLPEPIEEKKQEEQKSSAESKLEEKQKEQDFLDYFKQNKEQLAQLYPTEQEQPRAEAPQLTALDYYNQANQILSMQKGGYVEENEWLTNWYNNRVIPNKDIQNLYLEDKDIYLNRLKNIPNVEPVESIDNNPFITGRYDAEKNKILMTPNASNNVYLHELTHYSDYFPSAMRTVHGEVVRQNVAPKDLTQGIYNEMYDYFTDPDEIHARIQVLRKKAGLKPNQEVTPEILDSFLKEYKGEDENINDLLNVADPAHLLEMLNYMAVNDNKSLQQIQQGGIITDNRGQWAHPGKVTRITSPNITMQNVNYPVLGISEQTGEQKLMMPNLDYFFDKTKSVVEYPLMQEGGQWVEINRGDGKIERINTDSDEYRELYNQKLIGNYTNKGEVLLPELNEVTVTGLRASKDKMSSVDTSDFNLNIQNTLLYEDSILSNKDTFLPTGNRILKDDKIEPKNKEQLPYETILKDNKYNQNIKSISLKDVTYNDFDKLNPDIKQSIAKSFLEEQGLLKQAPKNKEEVQDLQRELKRLGFDLGTYGKNKDGVDGLYGKKTKNALDLYNKNILESSYDLVKERLKVKERESFINTKPENKDFFYLQNDDQIRDYQKVYSDKGYLKNKIEDFNFNFTAKDLKTDYKKFNTEFNKIYEKDESCYGEECASFVTLDILNNLKSFYGEEEGTKKFNESQVRGDAWTMNSTITKAGGSTTYNVFSEGKPKGIKNVKKYVESKIENAPKLDKSKVKVGDIVHMYYEKSGNFDKAYKEGDNIFSTHVGLIKEDKNGNLVVEHNVHGKVIHNKLDDFINKTYAKAGSSKIAITGLTSPKYNKREKKEEEVAYKVSSSPNQFDMNFISNRNSPFFKENLPLAQESLAVNKDKILKDMPITSTEYDNIEKAVLSIMWKESYANEMVDNPNFKDNPTSYFKKTLAPLREKVLGTEASKGLTQIKDKKNFTEDVQKNLIKDEKDLYDPKKSAIISLYSLSSKYLYLRDLSKKEGISITQDELVKLSMLSWNEDISVVGKTLSKYKDFDTVWEAYNTSKKTGEKEAHPYSKALSLYDNAFKKRISSR